MGRAPEVVVAPGNAVAMPTGGVMPDGADAVVMVEHTQETMPGTIEVVRPVAPGDGLVRADEDARAGVEILPAGRPLRAQDLGLLAAAGVTAVSVRARPRVAIVSTGDEVVAPATEDLAVGQVRDATASALAALVRDAGGDPDPRGIVPDDHDALAAVLRDAVASSDLVVVSAGSSVGARDETAAVVAEPGPARDLGPRDRAAPGQADAAGRLRRCAGARAARQPPLGARRVPHRRDADRPAGRRGRGAARTAGPGAPRRAASRRPPVASTSCRSPSATGSRHRCSGPRRS